MTKEMIISANGFERKIAIMDDGVLTEYYVERVDDESEGMVGNIYKGRVTKVLPGMQSAFVAIGLERDAFLYVADVFEGEEIEFEDTPPPRETKRPVSQPKLVEAGPVSARHSEEGVTEEEVEGILQAIAQTEGEGLPEPEGLVATSQRGYDEQFAELIESLAEDLGGDMDVGFDEDQHMSEVDLKDAIIEEKLIEAVHQEEEYMDELSDESLVIAVQEEPPETPDVIPEAPPTPGFKVGSLWTKLAADSSLQRIVDEPAIEQTEPASPSRDVATLERYEGVLPAPGAVESSRERRAEENGETDHASDEPVAFPPFTRSPDEPAAAAASENESEAPLEDAEASVRFRKPRADFAAHRKVRRRRTSRVREGEGSEEESPAPSNGGMPTITELLHEGQELLVQVAKEPIGAKGARVTSHIAIPGRYVVYMPTTEHVGVSRRIPSHTERLRLRKLAAKVRTKLKAGGGFIVRTAAEGCDEEQLNEDMKYLVRVWTDLRRRAEKVKAPTLMYREVDLVQRILRDRLSGDFAAIRVDSEQEYTQIIDFVDHFLPELVNRVKLHMRPTPIFERYGVQPEIDKSIRPRVWLKSGGYIVINQTEALVAIDVNTGKFVGKTNRFEDTITRTNMEAAKEIARQIRLRDLGGIIVLDFIDMEERKNRQKVMQVLEEEIRRDRAPAKVLSFNDFGLVAITRKRVKQSLERTLCEQCPQCHGSGMVKSPQTICYEILDEARRLSDEVEKGKEVILRVHPVVAQALQDKYRRVMESVESYLKGNLTIETDRLLHQEQFDLAMT